MSQVLIFLQSENGQLLKSSLCALSAAQRLKAVYAATSLVGICIGPKAAEAAATAAGFGLQIVRYVDAPEVAEYRAVPYAQAVIAAATQVGAKFIVAPGGSSAKDFMPRVAAHFDAGQASDVIGINDDKTYKRPMYAGNVIADVALHSEVHVVTVRSTAFAPAVQAGSSASVEALSVSFDMTNAGEVVSVDKAKSARPELGDAEVVVSGGRALQSAENFEKYIFPLADAFGAAVGASRAAVDSGYAPNDWQVGQTGKVVAPQLYVAVGISGAIQHLAGMKDSKVIVAINKDADAPIFEVADYGLVADLYQVVPELTEAIKKAKQG
jgi:electron transfer flavoprotein alpha subunit